jgi:hypothetical protein
MKIFVACESSGVVRDAFIRQGYDAVSCDLLPTERPGPHLQGDVRDFIGDGSGWDIIIAHPPCTYLCSSGLHWNSRVPGRKKLTEDALQFVCDLLNKMLKARVGGALENPVGCISTRIYYNARLNEYLVAPHNVDGIEPQYVQPYVFGEDASKKTGLWLVGLPPLRPTGYFPPRIVNVNGKSIERWGNQTDSGQNKLTPSADRWKLRSKTYDGIANAMAAQWGSFAKNKITR